MKLPRRNFLHLATGAVAPPAVSRIAFVQAKLRHAVEATSRHQLAHIPRKNMG